MKTWAGKQTDDRTHLLPQLFRVRKQTVQSPKNNVNR